MMNTKRVFSFILTIIMLLSVVLPIDVFADELIDEGWEEFTEETAWEDQLVEENLLDEAELIVEEQLYEENQDQYLVEEEIVDEQYSDNQDNEIFVEEESPVVEEEIPVAEEEPVDDSQPDNEEAVPAEAETFNAGTLKVEVTPLEIEAEASDTVEFEATVTGASGDVSYQWQYSQDGGQTWKTSGVSGNKTAKITIQATNARLPMLYRCKVTCNGKTAVSEGAHFIRPDTPFIWSTNADGTLTLVQYRENAASVVVPETYNGKTVTVIGESAFEGKDLTSIDLPDTITVIGRRAFAGCKNLSEMK